MGDQKYYDTEAFKKLIDAADKGNVPVDSGAMLHKGGYIELDDGEDAKDLHDDDRFDLAFTISTGTVDRHGDTIAPRGWALKNFRKNPVVLWAHNSRMMPVARSIKTFIDKDAESLRAVARFPSREENEFGNSVGRMIKARFLNMTSVGFRPIKFERSDDEDRQEEFFFPIDFLKQELLEFSIVPVPANPEAGVEARSLGIDLRSYIGWAEEALDAGPEGKQILVPRSLLEAAWKNAGGSTTSLIVNRNEASPGRVLWELAAPKTTTPPDPEPEPTPDSEPDAASDDDTSEKGDDTNSLDSAGDDRQTGEEHRAEVCGWVDEAVKRLTE